MNGAAPQSDAEPFWRSVPWSGLAVLAAAVLAAWAACAVVAFSRYGPTGLLAASVAAGVCWASASVALCLTAMFTSQEAVTGLLLSILLRTGVPLLAGVAISNSVRPLSEAGVFEFILIHYFVALAVETSLAVRLLRRRTALSPVSS